MLFGRNRHVKAETVSLPENLRHLQETEDTAETPAQEGPFDRSTRPDVKGLLDLGALKVPVRAQVPVRLDVEESSKRIIGVTLTSNQSTLQVQAFAAPRTSGLWDEIRAEIVESIKKNDGAQAGEKEGRFGTEVLARIPAAMPDGKAGWRVARFIGVDGPRWFVRGVFGGKAAFSDEAAAELEDMFAQLVVHRGETPLPPRELLPLTPPANMKPLRRPDAESEAETVAPKSAAPMPKRGPEITEIR
ncbi:DUF3710 domain-containing protein [Citricoccus muralis]|uniref:DUF3710 domain-containing protein n=1 Tax=Citricoccus muralis TaxID=169134 RepID=A0ABY8H2V5_9MICC|nr:DUF3710 domain-containing protein [Citricoccus muralis]WFP15459.1 DUF3710 domain-containing protein [Citricoccus muralis]